MNKSTKTSLITVCKLAKPDQICFTFYNSCYNGRVVWLEGVKFESYSSWVRDNMSPSHFCKK